MPALQTDVVVRSQAVAAEDRTVRATSFRKTRPRTDWITIATVYSAAVLTTIGSVVARMVDAVLYRERV